MEVCADGIENRKGLGNRVDHGKGKPQAGLGKKIARSADCIQSAWLWSDMGAGKSGERL